MIARRAKIEELRNLMQIELQIIRDGLKMDPSDRDFEQAEKGYPSFVKPWANSNQSQSHEPSIGWKHLKAGTHFKVKDGPSDHRVYLENVLEKLVQGKETEEDLKELDSFLLHLYTKKNPVVDVCNETEHDQMDFHQRMTKEIRRKQYAVGVREGSRSPERLFNSPGRIDPNPILPKKIRVAKEETSVAKEEETPQKGLEDIDRKFTKQVTGRERLNKQEIERQIDIEESGKKYNNNDSDDEWIGRSIVKTAGPITHNYKGVIEKSVIDTKPLLNLVAMKITKDYTKEEKLKSTVGKYIGQYSYTKTKKETDF